MFDSDSHARYSKVPSEYNCRQTAQQETEQQETATGDETMAELKLMSKQAVEDLVPVLLL